MFRIVRPASFFAELSKSPRLKFKLAGVSFGAIVLPSAFLLSLGISERHVLPLIILAVPLTQYLAFCLFESFDQKESELYQKQNPFFPALFHYSMPTNYSITAETGQFEIRGFSPQQRVLTQQQLENVKQQLLDAQQQLENYRGQLEHAPKEEIKLVFLAERGSGKSHLLLDLARSLSATTAREEAIKRQRKSLEISHPTMAAKRPPINMTDLISASYGATPS